MLKGIPAVVSSELLYALHTLGHGQRIALVDANYPCFYAGQKVIEIQGNNTVKMMEVLFELISLDQFSGSNFWYMIPDDEVLNPEMYQIPTLKSIIQKVGEDSAKLSAIRRSDFYEAAKNCAFTIRTRDLTPYACYIFQKGVIF